MIMLNQISKVRIAAGVLAVAVASQAMGMVIISAPNSHGVTVTIEETPIPVTLPPGVFSRELPLNFTAFDVKVTSATDILGLRIQLPLPGGKSAFNHSLGNNNAKPNSAFLNLATDIVFDTYVNLPGVVTVGGKAFSDEPNASNADFGQGGVFSVAFADTDPSGPQTDFLVARITVGPNITLNDLFLAIQGDSLIQNRGGVFGEVAVESPTGGPVFTNLVTVIPEPASLGLMGIGSLLIGLRRRTTRN